jgi:HK97 family phage prohead protease
VTSRLSYTRGTLASASPDGELVFTASAEGTNRYGFSLRKTRWKIDNFNANPVILWMHMDFTPPIGRGRASLDGQGLKTAVTFDRSDPFAMEIERKYRDGFLNAVSVGFDFVDDRGVPVERPWTLTPEQINNELYYDLAEVSAVPVPADPRALIRQRHALAADFGLSVPDDDVDDFRAFMSRWYGHRPEVFSVPWTGPALGSGPAMPMMPMLPTLPGNSDMERRLQRIEEAISKLSAPAAAVEPEPTTGEPTGEPDDPTGVPEGKPEVTEAHVDETEASALLEALSLSGKDGS